MKLQGRERGVQEGSIAYIEALRAASKKILSSHVLLAFRNSIKMGQAASAISNTLDNSKENEAKQKEQLELMMKLADARLDTFEGELKEMFLNRDSAMKTSVPGKRALRFERHVQVDTETTVCLGVI